MAKKKSRGVAPADLTEEIVDVLSALVPTEGMRADTIAVATKRSVLVVRRELRTLEGLGIVYRIGKTRGTKWFLG